MNTGTNVVKSKNGLLSTIAWKINGKTTYALEGSVFIAGAAIQWLRDGLNIITSAQESERNAFKSNENELVFIPAFSGLGAPYWNMNVKGAIFGITRDIGINELCKATLESLAFQTRDVLKAMELDSKIKLDSLSVDGGASNNNFLMQFQSDILNTKINKPIVSETTALGVAYLAGLYTKFFNLTDILKNHKIDSSFSPIMKVEIRNKKINLWNKAIKTISNN
jgi:glycerol kinase